jgi:hypothetical protein
MPDLSHKPLLLIFSLADQPGAKIPDGGFEKEFPYYTRQLSIKLM